MSKINCLLTYFEYDKLIAILQVTSCLKQDLQEDIINKVIALEFPDISVEEYDDYSDFEEPNVVYLDEQGIPYIF